MPGQEFSASCPEVHEPHPDGALNPPAGAADNPSMRRLLPLALLAFAVLPSTAAFGEDVTNALRVGMTRAEFTKVMDRRQPTVISDISGALAIESADPAVEFERYEFTQQTPDQPSRIWRITYAYRMPTDRVSFAALADSLDKNWGAPAENVSRPAEHGDPPYERRVWRQGNVSVTLAGYPDGQTTGEATRMQLVTVERRLQGMAMAESKKAPQPKK
jgi:hypothetical protein